MIFRQISRFQLIFFAIIGVAAFFPAETTAQMVGKQILSGHVPEAVSRLTPSGRLAAATRLNLAIGLPLRNQGALDDLLQQISDPASPSFRRYMTPEQFTERFGPTAESYQAAAAFFEQKGFKVTTHPNRIVLDVEGSAADIEKTFHVVMRIYRHPTENRNFFAPDTEPSVDLAIPILHVSGLDNFSLPRPKIIGKTRIVDAADAEPKFGSGPGGTYSGNDFRAAYLPGVGSLLSGAGQIIGLLEFDGYYSNDIVAYKNITGIPGVTLTNVLIDGFSGVPTTGANSGNSEVALDIDMAMAMAPGLSKIIVYEEPGGSPWPDMLNRMATDNLAKQLSCSWGNNSPSAPDPTSENIFKQMAAQGQTFFDASGDSDAFTSGIPFPGESTNIVQVGGTSLSTTGPGGARILETTWDWGGGSGSSGGVSVNYGIPIWQQGISMTANQGSTTKRNVPDVALTADNIFVVADNGTNYVLGGTSAAAPLWAAFTALANQQAVAGGKPTVGFINPAVYVIGKGANYLSDFNDIMTGNNLWNSSTSKFSAVAGFDLCTGWGTPAGENLIDALAAVSDALAVAPGTGFAAFGPVGGAFTSSAQNFLLTNSGAAPLNWSLINTSLWLKVSATGGTLSPGGPATNVIVSLNPAAYNLSAGIYIANVLFTNNTSHAVRDRQFTLLVGQQLIRNGGFEDGVLSFWAQTGASGNSSGYNYDFVDDSSKSGINPHSGTYLAVFGASGVTGYISQTIATVPGQAYLLSFWLTNPSGGKNQQFFVNWNTNAVTTNTIFNLSSPGAFNWTNAVFIVTATSTNTVLQFAARNDPAWFGLDDASLLPIPIPSFNAFFKTNHALKFMWNSLAGVQYQLQFSTNLLNPNWLNLGNVITANNVTAVTTNSALSDPVRFYRVKQLP